MVSGFAATGVRTMVAEGTETAAAACGAITLGILMAVAAAHKVDAVVVTVVAGGVVAGATTIPAAGVSAGVPDASATPPPVLRLTGFTWGEAAAADAGAIAGAEVALDSVGGAADVVGDDAAVVTATPGGLFMAISGQNDLPFRQGVNVTGEPR